MTTINDILPETLKQYVEEALSWSSLLYRCGYSNIGNKKYLVLKLDEYKIDYSHLDEKNQEIYKTPKSYTLDEIFCVNSSYKNYAYLKIYLIKHYGRELKCSNCNIIDWMGKPLTMELDHINGIRNDNRVENLLILCPNCHGFTSNYKAKNKKEINEDNNCIDCQAIIEEGNSRCDNCEKHFIKLKNFKENKPTLDEINELLKTLSITQVAEKFDVTKFTIQKLIRDYSTENN